MSDIVNNPNTAEAELPYELAQAEKDWINEEDGKYKEHRFRGLDVMHRIQIGLPISELEQYAANKIDNNTGWANYRKDGVKEDHIAILMADSIGTFLTSPPKKPEFYDEPEFAKLMDFSDYDAWQKLSPDRSREPTKESNKPQGETQ